MITDRKIGDWTSPVSGEADRPNRSAADMKAVFDANSNELKTALNGVIDDIGAGAAALAFTQAASRANIESGDSLATILGKLAKFYADAQTAVNTIEVDEETHNRYLSADGTYTVPEAGEAANGLPDGGTDGQLLVKDGTTDYAAEWADPTPSLIGAAAESVEATAALAADGWTASGDGYAQTVSVSGVTAAGHVLVCPAPASFDDWCNASVRATVLGAGTVTFYATSVPEADLAANILIVG